MGQKLNEKEWKVPEHIAIILDGNGRWAKKRGMPRNFGHLQGAKNVEQICSDAYDLGVKYLTVYTFSTENWKRSVEEVNGIMNILRQYLNSFKTHVKREKLTVRVIGDRSRLDDDINELIDELWEMSKDHKGLTLTLALNYGGRDEITRAVRKLADQVKEGALLPEQIDEAAISKELDTYYMPDPDLLIRTSGELRLSNYLLWQLAYTEFYFTDVLWPDFDKKELEKAIEYYNGRDRRYGGVK
ncbi:MAG: isoprenyl transferase [Clostridium sp.]|jgi:undecaprenyl diphosphate synthase|nr:isoprenyl transferase [Lachnospiraceae bacterium]MBS6466009.1 isoprenyl transferase [Clostridium sp.]MDD6266957.1 isoprenyl transferase [Clostridium sp.]